MNENTDVPDHASRADTWVVIPLFNEAAVIAEVVRGIRESFPQVVCVDDGSTDASAAAARATSCEKQSTHSPQVKCPP